MKEKPSFEQDPVPGLSPGRANHAGRRRSRSLIGLALSLGLVGVAQAAPGDLDPSFSGDGMVIMTAGGAEAARSIALQPDGRIVAAGESFNGVDRDFALARYNPDGSLDPTFGGDGIVTTAVGVGDDRVFALALQPDGRIVAAGESFNGVDRDFALARYNPDGSLDPT
ncbi:MAG: delta-60 repeat domain-containing protein, partial [Actinomycetota bacterium]